MQMSVGVWGWENEDELWSERTPPVGKNWRGGARKCACLAEDCSSSFFSLPVPCNAIQCQWLFVNNMDDHVRRMSHWCVWSSVLFVALIHQRREVPVHFHRYLFTHRSKSMMIDWLVETTKSARCDVFTAQDRQASNQSRRRRTSHRLTSTER